MNALVIFDLDGTLLNTLADLTNSVNFAMTQLNLKTYSQEEVKMMVGNGVSVLMRRALTEKNASLHAEALQLQRAYYAEHGTENTHPYPQICEMLQNLRACGYKIAVHTNKDENVAKKLCLEKFGALIDYVCGTVEDSQTKPDATRLLKLLADLGGPKAVYCGDSDVDIQTAKNANLPCISVTWGFRDKAFLTAHGASYFADTPQEVVALVRRIAAKK